MASFTDQQLTPFTPYVTQLPVQAMVQVGMQKQAQYDQGVQKIQTQIDNVAGMDIGRDPDKTYLQSKLDELGGKLKTVAAGDFSNQQLVNSVGGMATSIVKDPIIKAAVYSTALDKQNLAEMDNDQKSGKLQEQDKWLYNQQRSAYYSNNKLTDERGNPITLNSKYERTADINKLITEQLKLVGDGKWTAEKVFVTNSDGSFVYENGKPKLSEYTTRTIKEGKLPQNVLSAIHTTLDSPDAQKALAVRGMYEYRGYTTAGQFADYLTNQVIDANSSMIGSLNAQKMDLLQKANAASNSDEKGSYELLASQIDDKLNVLNKEATTAHDVYMRYGSNLDALKSVAYQKKITSDYLNMFNPSVSETYEKSAPWEAQQQRIKQEFDIMAKRQEIAISQGQLKVAEGHLTLAEELGRSKDKLDWAEFYKKYPEGSINPLLGAADGEFSSYGTILAEGKKLSDSYDDVKQKFVKDYFLALNHSQGKTDDTAILRDFNNQLKQNPTKFYDTWLEKAQSDVTKNKNSTYYTGLAQQLPTLEGVQGQMRSYNNRLNDLNNDPRVKSTNDDLKDLEAKLNNAPKTITLNIPGEHWWSTSASKKTFNITPTDLLNIANGAFGSEIGNSKIVETAQRAAEVKFGIPWKDIKDQMYGTTTYYNSAPITTPGIGGEALSAATSMITSQKHLENLRAKEAVAKEKMKADGPQIYEMYSPNAKSNEIESINDRLKTVIGQYVSTNNMSDYEKAYAGSKDERDKYKINIGYYPNESPDNAFKLELRNGSHLIKSTTIPKQWADYVNGPIKLQPRISDIAKQVKWTNGSSNIDHVDPTNHDAWKTAYFSSSRFSNLGRNDIVGADSKDYGNGPVLWFYQKDAKGNVVPIPFKQGENTFNFSNVDALNEFINGLNSTTLNAAISPKK
jgi:hypothetical protein